MDWNTIVTTLLTACIPALIAYLTAVKQAQSKLAEVDKNTKLELEKIDKNNQNELEKMKLEYELKLKQADSNSTNELTTQFLSGNLDLSNMNDQVEKLNDLTKLVQTLQKSDFVKNRK